MIARKIDFLLVSLSLHLAAFWTLSMASAGHGVAAGKRPAAGEPAALSVRLLRLQEPVPDPAARLTSTPVRRDAAPAGASQAAEPASPAQPTKSGRDAAPPQQSPEYLPAGELTRLPVPLIPTDLDIEDLAEMQALGEIEFTLLIDAGGAVAQVQAPQQQDSERQYFVERVAGLFRKARFLPGEIDGRPVNARLQITVVSAPQPSPEVGPAQ